MRTKIICTLGPSTNTEKSIAKLIENGMDIARINFSHGNYDEHSKTIMNIKNARGKRIQPAIALDTKGPEIRLDMLDSEMLVKKNQKIKISNNNGNGTIRINIDNINQIKAGMKILIDDGKLRLNVLNINENSIMCISENEHVVKRNKAVNIPNISLNESVPTEKDKNDIKFGIEHGIDMIFLSFVNSASEILAVRNFISGLTDDMPIIISKIESVNGLKNVEEIANVSDGIMVARGDLSVEIGLEKTFSAQKEIIEICGKLKCPVIMATQMLESMCENIMPTRAEISDIGNAVLDRCDCVMLSGETASGKYPFKCLKIMKKIILDAENFFNKHKKTNQNVLIKIISTQKEILNFNKTEHFWDKMYIISKKLSALRKVSFLLNVHTVHQSEIESRKSIIEKLINKHDLKSYLIED